MKATILLVEDSQSQGAHVKRLLESLQYNVLWAQGGIEGLRLAKQDLPDLIILDVVMEDMDGHAVCRWLKLNEQTRDIPIIMLTVKADIDDRVAGLHVGADDYLPKPFNDRELEARIYAALRVKATQSELKKRNQQLESLLQRVESMAITDPLTGLFNRRRFNDVLRREFATTQRYGNELSCLMIDIDHFKRLNDTYGHDAGDRTLKQIAITIASTLREVDVPARYGGEEFAVLLPHTAKERAAIVAERILRLVEALALEIEGTVVRVTISVGVAAVSDLDGKEPERLVTLADSALYEAKRLGRARVVLYAPPAPAAPTSTA